MPVPILPQIIKPFLHGLEKTILSILQYMWTLMSLIPNLYYSQFSNNPISSQTFNNVKGEMTIPQLSKIIQDVSLVTNIAGITFAEHMPWDALNLKKMMEQFSFMK